MINLENKTRTSSKLLTILFPSMSQSTVSYFLKGLSTAMSFLAVPPWEPFWIDLPRNCMKRFFSKLKPNFIQKHWLHFFNQCLSRCSSTCKVQPECSILCLFSRTGNLVRQNCPKLLDSLTGLDEHIRFFPTETSRFILP